MKKPPLWKVKRELKRFGRQIVAAPALTAEYFLATRRYDRVRHAHIKRFQGAAPDSDRVAIYLIFPATGLLGSHLLALDYLTSKGYAPLVVSNLALSDEDRDRILTRCWSYLERPNVGYDFGGYRDAMLELAPRFGTLERLAIFNDSAWFPLPGARDWLDMAEAMNVDYAGAASHYGAHRPDLRDFGLLAWHYSTEHKNFHYTSYALLMRPPVFRHPGFLRYWQKLHLTRHKKRTVRRGEIGLSQWVLQRGFSNDATLGIAHLDRDLQALGDSDLRLIADNLIIPEDPRMRAMQHRKLAGSPDRNALIALILFAVTRQGASYSLPAYSIPHRGYPFLKKSPIWLERESSDTTLRIAEGLEGPAGQVILEEARALRRTRGARLDAPKAT